MDLSLGEVLLAFGPQSGVAHFMRNPRVFGGSYSPHELVTLCGRRPKPTSLDDEGPPERGYFVLREKNLPYEGVTRVCAQCRNLRARGGSRISKLEAAIRDRNLYKRVVTVWLSGVSLTGPITAKEAAKSHSLAADVHGRPTSPQGWWNGLMAKALEALPETEEL